MSIELKHIEGVFWINREEATRHLTDGFVEIFGEDNREFFESIQDEMIDEGIKAGRIGYRSGCFGNMTMYTVSQNFEKDEEKKRINEEWFFKFFSKKEHKLALSNSSERLSGGPTGPIHPYFKNCRKYEDMFVDRFAIQNCDGECEEGECYCNTKPPKLNLFKNGSKSWQYFKELKHSYMGMHMFGGGGLGLDSWSKKEVKYMLFEGEWFYFPERMHILYYYLGAQIGKCQLKEEFFNEINDKFEPGVPECIQNITISVLNSLSTDYDENVLIPIIRKEFKRRHGRENELENMLTSEEVKKQIDLFLTDEKQEELIALFKKNKK